ncbi:MAG: outer membrane protein assembly factor BamE [Pseudomonadota bacterium]|nr:outer membrane protein assembly factor BamE [Pseudomonadota bacterium]
MDLDHWLLSVWLLQRTAQIKVGMTKQEVVSVLGNPNRFQCSGGYETLRYTSRRSGRAREKTGFSVILKDGRVVKYGAHYSKGVAVLT